eukprot:TRINITY_DN25121_c0_g1_i1.p1 TRINITY_DN25121_c0_g1~~TRINITY_DN25121_c0_g1_i1.p1  ORF type:complete len:958 (+),score=290.00 TRINITY_DN25121_c0_g1_i1:90-2876(+)
MPEVPVASWRPRGSAPARYQHRWAVRTSVSDYDRLLAKAVQDLGSNAVWRKWLQEDAARAAVAAVVAAAASTSCLADWTPQGALELTCPEHPELAGSYALTSRNGHNGMPLWSNGKCRLFSDSAGQWRITDDPAAVARDCGWYTTVHAHQGRMPHRMADWEHYAGKWPDGKWERSKLKCELPKPKKDAPAAKKEEKKEEPKKPPPKKALPGFFEGKPTPKNEGTRLLGDSGPGSHIKLRLWWDLSVVKTMQEGGSAAGKAQGKYGGWQDSTSKYVDQPCICISRKPPPGLEGNTWNVRFNDGVERLFSSALLYRSMWRQLRALLFGVDSLAGGRDPEAKPAEKPKEGTDAEAGKAGDGKKDPPKAATVKPLARQLLGLRLVRLRPRPPQRPKGKESRDAALKAAAQHQPPPGPQDACLFAGVLEFLFHFPAGGAPPGRLELLRRCFIECLTQRGTVGWFTTTAEAASAPKLRQAVEQHLLTKFNDPVSEAVVEGVKPGGPNVKWEEVAALHRKAAQRAAQRALASKTGKKEEKKKDVERRGLIAAQEPCQRERELARLCKMLELAEGRRGAERRERERLERELEAVRWGLPLAHDATPAPPRPCSPPPPPRPLGEPFSVLVEPPARGSLRRRPFEVSTWPGEALGELRRRVAQCCDVDAAAISLAILEGRHCGALPRRWQRLPPPGSPPDLAVSAAGVQPGSVLRCLPAGTVRLSVRLGPSVVARLQVYSGQTLREAAQTVADHAGTAVGVLCWPGGARMGGDADSLDAVGLHAGTQADVEMRRRPSPADPAPDPQTGRATAPGARPAPSAAAFPAAAVRSAVRPGELGQRVAAALAADAGDRGRVPMAGRVASAGCAVRRLAEQTAELSAALGELVQRVGAETAERPASPSPGGSPRGPPPQRAASAAPGEASTLRRRYDNIVSARW